MFSIGRGSNKTLAIIGDSLTADRNWLVSDGATPNQTYPVLIAKLRGFGSWINAGIPGNTAAQMDARFDADILAHQPNHVGIMAFTNDQTTNCSGSYPSITWTGAGTSVASTKASIKAMVQRAQARGAGVTIMSPPPQRYEPYLSHTSAYLTALSEIASETGCQYMDIYSRVNGLTTAQQNALYISTDQLGHWSYAGHAYARDMAAEAGNAACFLPL